MGQVPEIKLMMMMMMMINKAAEWLRVLAFQSVAAERGQLHP